GPVTDISFNGTAPTALAVVMRCAWRACARFVRQDQAVSPETPVPRVPRAFRPHHPGDDTGNVPHAGQECRGSPSHVQNIDTGTTEPDPRHTRLRELRGGQPERQGCHFPYLPSGRFRPPGYQHGSSWFKSKHYRHAFNRSYIALFRSSLCFPPLFILYQPEP